VAQVSYLGNILRYAVEIAPGQLVTVDVQNASGTLPLAFGASVLLSWLAADSELLLQ
jgi:TOBE domain